MMVSLSCQQGRGSGFPGRRRARGSGVTGRGGRGRARMKNGIPPIPTPGVCLNNYQLLHGLYTVTVYSKYFVWFACISAGKHHGAYVNI